MKDKLKKCLLALALICTPFSMVACGNNDNGGGTNTGGGTSQNTPAGETTGGGESGGSTTGGEETQESINNTGFNTLKSSIKSTSNPQTFEEGFTLTSTEKYSTTMHASKEKNSTLDDETLKALNDNYDNTAKISDSESTCVTSYSKANQMGFSSTIGANYGEPYSYFTLFTQESGKYYEYYYHSASTDSDSESKYKYETLDSYWIGLTQDIQDALGTVRDFTTFADYDAMEKGIIETILNDPDMNINFMAEDIKNQTIKITKNNSSYTMSIELAIAKDKLDTYPKLEDFKSTITFNIEFDENTILNGKMNSNMTGTMSTKLDEETSILTDMNISTELSFNISKQFKSSLMPTIEDKSAFTNMGMVKTNISYYVDGYELTRSESVEAGKSITLYKIDKASNIKPVVWYTDPECTKEANFTTMPPYGLCLYTKDVKLSPGYSWVLYKTMELSSIDYPDIKKEDVTKELVESKTSLYGIYNIAISPSTNLTGVYGLLECDLIYVNGTIKEKTTTISLDENILNEVIFIILPKAEEV